jgi:small conductance mechanosensitive channel
VGAVTAIRNFSTNSYLRVDLVAQPDHTMDHHVAAALLKAGMSRIPNVLKVPGPDVEILTFILARPVLAARPCCAQPHYWPVYFDTNLLIRENFGAAGFPAPENHVAVRSIAA